METSRPQPAVPTLTATPTSAVCLDEVARPMILPPRQDPLEVRFTNQGDIWVWNEGVPQATQVTDTGNVAHFSFSPDGQVIAFQPTKMWIDQPWELWAIDRDGSNLRQLFTDEQVKTLAGEPIRTDEEYTYGLGGQLVWVEGARMVGFEVQRGYEGLGGCCEYIGHFQVDVDTGEVTSWTAPQEPLTPDYKWLGTPGDLFAESYYLLPKVSPDDQWIAIPGETSLSIADAGGRIVHKEVLTYESFLADVEAAPTYAPILVWSRDSTSLYAAILLEAIFSGGDDPNAAFAIWQVMAGDGSVRELRTLAMVPHSLSVSPNQAYMTYLKGTQAGSNERELHLATVDGSQDMVYAWRDALEFWGWAPDGVHFVFAESTGMALQWGNVCDNPLSLLEAPERPHPEIGINWVDADRFLFVSDGELRLGQVGDGSLLMGPFDGDYNKYQFNRDEKALGGLK